MKKIFLWLLLLMLAGCGSTTETIEPPQEEAVQEVVPAEGSSTSSSQTDEIEEGEESSPQAKEEELASGGDLNIPISDYQREQILKALEEQPKSKPHKRIGPETVKEYQESGEDCEGYKPKCEEGKEPFFDEAGCGCIRKVE